MAEKLLIGISAEGATVAHWTGRISECREFSGDAAGQAAFKEYLSRFSNVPVHIVVDAVEEDYRFETLPHAFGSDRSEMVNRKLKQHYRASPYVAATLLGRDTGKRRDDRYLFSALTNADLIDDWVQAVATRGLPIAGIYLVPMVGAALLEKVDVKATNLLLVAPHASGLRLTFFRERQFRLSRLTRGDSGRLENRTRYYAEEISNTRLYLHALRTMTLDEHLTVLLIDRSDELAEVAAGVSRENPSLDCLRLDRRELTARFGLPVHVLDASPYAIYLQLLGMKEPAANLASATVTQGYRRYRARRAIYAACGALAAAAAVWTGINASQIFNLRGDTEIAARRTADNSARYAEITRQFPRAPTTAENLKKAVEVADKLRASTHTPQRLMSIVSEALASSPTVIVKEFGWKYGTTDIDSQGSGQQSAPASAGAPAVTINNPGASNRKESALLEGEIRPFRGDYRSAIVTINALAERIGQNADVASVRVAKLPLNVNPSLSLSGNTLDNPEQSATAKAEFKLLITLKPAT